MFAGVLAYLRRYPHTLIAPLMLQTARRRRHAPSPDRRADWRRWTTRALAPVVQHRAAPGRDQPAALHAPAAAATPTGTASCTRATPRAETLHRHLLWTIYLNDGFDEGETEFLYQQRKIAPRTGSLLIAPAAFTHTHRGNRPQGGDKFIATSWMLFQRAEAVVRRG